MVYLALNKRFLRSGIFNNCKKLKVQTHQLRQIQIVHSDLHTSKKEYDDISKNNRLATLKFDPSNEISDFTSFGILPFLQSKLNDFLLPPKHKVTSAPDFNIAPTNDQRSLLSILNSDYSVVVKGSAQSGKSLALILYALNFSLSRVPNFGVLKKSPTIDSIILVPTDELIDKYKYYLETLTKDIPPFCCPDEIVLEADDTTKKYNVSRRPLSVELVYSDKSNKIISTGPEEKSKPPHILITTPNQLFDIINEEDSFSNKVRKETLSEVRFFAVDDVDFHINNTDISNNYNFMKAGKKSKYVSKIEKIIHFLQSFEIEFYLKKLLERLRVVEKMHRKSNKENFINNKFDHAQFVYDDNRLSINMVDDLLDTKFKDVPESDKPNSSLLKRLIKHKRKVLYKPIQYCFISHPQHPYQQILQRLSAKKTVDRVNEAIKQQTQKMISSTKFDESLHKLYTQYLIEKETRIEEKEKNEQTSFIEKMIRFDDSKRNYRNQERKLLTIGDFNLYNNKRIDVEMEEIKNKKVNAYFIEATNHTKKSKQIMLRDIDITKNLPSKIETMEILKDDIKISKYNLKNIQKCYLKNKMMTNLHENKNIANITKIISRTIKSFRSEYPLNISPLLIILPPYMDLLTVSENLNKNDSLDKFSVVNKESSSYISDIQRFFSDQSSKENDLRNNLLVHPSQLIGQNYNGCSNMVVVGLDCLLPQLAFSSWNVDIFKDLIKDISGIENPTKDLAYFYLYKLVASSNSNNRTLVFVLDTFHEKNTKSNKLNIEQDIKRLGQIIIYNNLCDNVNVTKLLDDSHKPREITYGIDKAFVDGVKKGLLQQNL